MGVFISWRECSRHMSFDFRLLFFVLLMSDLLLPLTMSGEKSGVTGYYSHFLDLAFVLLLLFFGLNVNVDIYGC